MFGYEKHQVCYLTILWCVVGTLLWAGFAYAADHESNPEFKNPPERRSVNGVLQTTLRVAYKKGKIGEKEVNLRAYRDHVAEDDRLVGPAYRLRAGDLLKIHLINDLPEDQIDPVYNYTNLHTHGLHVSPAGNSDNVLITIAPGQDFHNEINIPDDHAPGTHWFHPHRHGSTAIQVSSSMSGALIIEGAIDEWERIARMREKIFILQQIPFDENGEIKDLGQANNFDPEIHSTTINGLLQPVIRMRPGQIERWRFIHSGVSQTIDLQVEDPDKNIVALHEFAKDGIATGNLTSNESVTLQPGYRSDVLFQAGDTGVYTLWDDETRPEESLLAEAEEAKPIAIIRVEGDPMDMVLPNPEAFERFRAYKPIEDNELVEEMQEVWFEITDGKYMVNGKVFDDPDAETRQLVLGQTQKWHIWTKNANHPFHIHVNPFEVIERNGNDEITARYWKDTILIAAAEHTEENPLEIRSRYQTYIGTFVLHCHNLNHEDLGMMQQVEIVTPGDVSGSHHH